MSNRTQYENDLAALKTALTEMGQSAADAVEAAMAALCTADAEAAAAVAQGDGRINNMERDIEHRGMTLLLRQQPVAGDLRRISTAMKVVTDVERIGDHASDIAEIIPHLGTVRKEGDPAVSQAIKMGQKAREMILDALHALPKNCWFVNYLRCHDDIGWGLDEAVENRLGIDPQKHKEYLYHFYEGNFPGSWAKGELYNYDPATGDARSCGTTASLCGIEQALEKDDKTALDYAVKRDLLLHTAMAFLQGFPMLNCGDEIAQLNGWDYNNDPDRVEDSRNLHRSKFNWEDAKQRTQKGTLQNQLWQGMEQLRQMRADPCFAPDAWVTTWDSHNPGVLALVRKRGEETLVGLFNFTEYPAGAGLDALGGKYHTPEGASVWLADVELEPYQALLVKSK